MHLHQIVILSFSAFITFASLGLSLWVNSNGRKRMYLPPENGICFVVTVMLIFTMFMVFNEYNKLEHQLHSNNIPSYHLVIAGDSLYIKDK